MAEYPRDKLEFVVRFVCGFVVFGIGMALIVGADLFLGERTAVLIWAGGTLILSLLAGIFGDRVWKAFFDHFH